LHLSRTRGEVEYWRARTFGESEESVTSMDRPGRLIHGAAHPRSMLITIIDGNYPGLRVVPSQLEPYVGSFLPKTPIMKINGLPQLEALPHYACIARFRAIVRHDSQLTAGDATISSGLRVAGRQCNVLPCKVRLNPNRLMQSDPRSGKHGRRGFLTRMYADIENKSRYLNNKMQI
jgi:hypothetical protein